jgi:hypothetical protein
MADIKTYNNKDYQSTFTNKNLPDPTNNGDAANKQYVDNTINALIFQRDQKDGVVAVATSNITLAGSAPNTLDGVTLQANDRIAVVGQSNAAQNGIYTVTTLGTGSNGTWTRATDADSNAEVNQGMCFNVAQGTNGAGSTYLLTTANPITLGTTNLTFTKTNVGTVKGYTGTLSSGSSSYTVTHNLATNNTVKAIRDSSTGEDVEGVKFTLIDTNSFTADFGVTTSNNYVITVTGV